MKLLIINLGGTSSKIAVTKNQKTVFQNTLRHEDDPEFNNFDQIWDQYDYRKTKIFENLYKHNQNINNFDAIVSRGTPVKAMNSGAYRISNKMINDAKSGQYGTHPTSIGCLIAFNMSKELNIPALTIDAPCIDELIIEARLTGFKGIERKSFYQALNQKAIGRKLAFDLAKNYDDLNAIIIHMGGGMSIAAHLKGKVIDVNNGLDGDGPMSPERAGTIPAGELLKLAFSKKYSYNELYQKINGKGGLYSLTNSKDGKEIEKKINEGDISVKEAYDAMIYQIAKSIGSAAVSLKGEIDAIAFTGGLAYSSYLIEKITDWISFLAPIYLYPGENEIESLRSGALNALNGLWPIQEY